MGQALSTECPCLLGADWVMLAIRWLVQSTSAGTGRELVWKLAVKAGVRSKSTNQLVAYDFTVAGNGTVLSMRNRSAGGSPVRPLRQFRRGQPFA